MFGSEGAARTMRVVRSRARTSVRSQGSQSGFTLIEILVCVVLMGTVILALASGMLTLIKTTSATSERQRIQLALGSLTESLKTSPYIPCGSVAGYQASYGTATTPGTWPEAWRPPSGSQIQFDVVEVEHWDETPTPTPTPPSAGFTTSADCPTTDQGAQRLTVEVTLPSGRTGTAQVVKDSSP